MENAEVLERLAVLERKIDATYKSSERMRKYFLATLIVSALLFIIPLIGLLFEIPTFISTYTSIGNM